MDQAVTDIVNKILAVIVRPIVEVIFAAAIFMFIYGIVEFLLALNRGGHADEGRWHMLWGLIGMLIMVSAYGIIALIRNTLGV